MAGIYLHIPFCKQACHYCNFHFSTSLRNKEALLAALQQEIRLQKDYLQNAPIETVYFGGGTPSLLSADEINQLFEVLQQYHSISPKAEVTLEANPDDLSEAKLRSYQQTPINRLSIGIQSFSETDLRYMNRAHNSDEAKTCVQRAQSIGFQNLTVDLIYGSPTTSNAQWLENLETVVRLNVPHLSCYCLTVEPDTALGRFVEKGKVAPVSDAHGAVQFELLMSFLEQNGYEQYEISNFAQPNCYAQHNSNYWSGIPYLGLGPSAHSFNGTSRQWNVANNANYIQQLGQQQLPFEIEHLTLAQRYNEYVMTSLRTMWGCNLDKINEFGTSFSTYFLENSASFLKEGLILEKEKNKFVLSNQARFRADGIASELFWID
jgi:oxygen-independent coproporphyrinogen III oxidase